jgi:hypothetical protein
MPRGLRTLSPLVFFAVVFSTACADRSIPTPLETAQADVLTSYDEMMTFFGELQAQTEAFTMETVGTSEEGRKLVLLHFTGTEGGQATNSEKLKVLIFAQQHGDEHSGMQAAVTLTRDIATGAFADFQQSVDFYLIPQVNPDGSELRQRRNAEGKDLNRDHLPLTTPEVQTVHRVFQEIMPEVVLDVHEYGFASRAWVEQGIWKNFGQQIDGLTNANMPMALRSYAVDRVIATMREELVSRDVTLNRYLVTDGPDARFRHSTAALNDGRNSTGIYNALTFLIEGMNGLTVEDNIRERARQQLETMKAFLNYFGENGAEVKEMVEGQRAALAGPNPPGEVALVMDYVRDPANPNVSVGVKDVETGAESSLVIEEYFPRVEATLHVARPLGYAIPPSQTELLAVLERHGIEMTRLEASMGVRGELYLIEGVEEMEKEDKAFLAVEVQVREGQFAIPQGHIFVRCQGIQSNLIVSLLEPQSQWGLAPLPEFRQLLEVGSEYPILRVLEILR